MNDFNLDRSAPGLDCGEFKDQMREYDAKKLVRITLGKTDEQPTKFTAIAGQESTG